MASVKEVGPRPGKWGPKEKLTRGRQRKGRARQLAGYGKEVQKGKTRHQQIQKKWEGSQKAELGGGSPARVKGGDGVKSLAMTVGMGKANKGGKR